MPPAGRAKVAMGDVGAELPVAVPGALPWFASACAWLKASGDDRSKATGYGVAGASACQSPCSRLSSWSSAVNENRDAVISWGPPSRHGSRRSAARRA